MTSAGEAIVNEILRDLRAHGFTKLRVTTHGTIYGLDRFRISLPNNMPDIGHNSLQERLRKRWEEVKSEAYGALPGLKAKVLGRSSNGMTPSEVDGMEPLTPLEVVLPPAEEGEMPSDEAKVMWQCPKCHKKLKAPGRHAQYCGTKYVRKSQAKHAPQSESVTQMLDRLRDVVVKLAAERDSAVHQLAAVKASLKS